MTTPPAQINWDAIGQPQFDRIVEQLLIRFHSEENPDFEVMALEGRGGDGGRDVDAIRATSYEIIYQLKYFPQGFSGEFGRSRKPQIKRSFNAAMKFRPKVWTLVAPRNFTVGERDFIRSLKKGNSAKIRFVGRAELDGLLIRFPDIHDWAIREPLVDTLRAIAQEKAALNDPRDLETRALGLQSLSDARNPNWGLDWGVSNGRYVSKLRAKHPRAQEIEPVGLQLTGRIESDRPEFEQFRRIAGFGVDEKVVLPSDTIEKVETKFPSFYNPNIASKEEMQLELSAGRTLKEDVHVELRVLDADGFTIASHAGPATHLGRGFEGVSVQANLTGGTEMTFLFPQGDNGETGIGELEISHSMAGLSAGVALKGIELRRTLFSGGRAEVLMDGQMLVRFQPSEPECSDDQLLGSDTELLIEDLARIEAETDVTLVVPEQLTNHDRLVIRVARLMLDGVAVIDPFHRQLVGVLKDPGHPGMQALLADQPVDPVRHEIEGYWVSILGKKLKLGTLVVVIEEPKIENVDELRLAVAKGVGIGATFVMRPPDGIGIKMFLAEKVPFPGGSPTEIAPWGVDGLDEHKEYVARFAELCAEDAAPHREAP